MRAGRGCASPGSSEPTSRRHLAFGTDLGGVTWLARKRLATEGNWSWPEPDTARSVDHAPAQRAAVGVVVLRGAQVPGHRDHLDLWVGIEAHDRQ